MIKNYLKLGLRNLAKNKLSSFINIMGLALAVGCCLVTFEFFDWSIHMDRFHSKVDQLYILERVAAPDGNRQLWGDTPSPMGPMLKTDFPQIKNSARLAYQGVVIKQGDNVFREGVSFVDDSFYKMFDFPVKWGSAKNFTNPDGIVLSLELSEKLFNKQNPVGKTLTLRFNNNGKEMVENFTINGVFAKRPRGASFYFSALAPYSRMVSLGFDKPGAWGNSVSTTFVLADNKEAFLPVQQHIAKYLQLYNAANTDNKIVGFNFQPLNTISFYGNDVKNLNFNSSTMAAYVMLVVIGLAILLLVYFNYMNIAIASAATRLKEIGVRKVMGSSRKQIIVQFITENLILCTIGIALGAVLGRVLFVPLFGQMANIDLSTGMFDNYRLWIALVVLVILSALGGASYPSFYISAFKPVSIMKGNSQMGSRNRFRKALLGFQFFLTFLAISVAVAFIGQTKQMKARPWGYTPENNVVVKLDKAASYDAFKDELKNNSNVKAVTGSDQPLGNWSKQMVVKADGKEQTVQSIDALPGFATQMGISITKGRDLNEQFKSDETDAVLVNQVFVKQMHWQSAIGKIIEYQNHQYKVVGETNDFHFESFQTQVGPMILMGCKPADVNFVYVKTSGGLFTNAHTGVQNTWKKINPNLPFEYYYQETVFDGFFSGFIQVSQVMGATSIIMIIISVSGIFGLALLILGKKMKEISVRKVLGAGMGTIVYIINKEFLYAMGAALLIGLPFSYWITGVLFSVISSDAKVSISPLILAFVSLIVMTAISVSWHIFKAYVSNPTKYLKDE